MLRCSRSYRITLASSCSAALLAWSGVAVAQSTDISPIPPATETTGVARSNLMFILDDSTSMSFDYLPDDRNSDNRCFGYFGWNKQFYNPNVTYAVPVQANGTSFPAPIWPTVFNDGYAQAGGTTTLNSSANGPVQKNSERFWYTTWSGTGTPTSCTNSQYTRVTTLPTAQQQNYANWWSYYRTRQLTARAGVGRAFADIDATKVRVGFTTISETGVADGSEFLNIRDFDALAPSSTFTQKELFFDRLYSASTRGPSGSINYTPLRPALVKAGRYFANKLSGQIDPVQYSCQRNYTILTTDGYWNRYEATAGGTEPNNYVPRQVDGTTAIGNQDGGTTPYPYKEGTTAVSNSLADIAMHYYTTDLRTSALSNCTGALGADVCANNVVVSPGSRDTASHQHMTTYTIGLGVNGVLNYDKNYETPTGDYAGILNGSVRWPDPLVSSDDNAVVARIDDLWHAAVNGRGYYYSAGDAQELGDSLSESLNAIGKDPGSAAAASTSSLRPISGDDKIFIGKYNPADWSGELEAYTINVTTGAITNPSAPNWRAGLLLQNRNLSTSPRSIYFFKGSEANKLASFSHANLSSTQQGFFNNLCTAPAKLSQCGALSSNATALAKVTGPNVVSYLAGTRTLESDAAAVNDRIFRARSTPLGDLVNASPIFVKKPPFKYADAGYASFAAAQANRTGVVYAAANDGMLHAFNAATGAELWAYVPSVVMPNMYRLADEDYEVGENHRFFVDATPVMGDVFDGTNWRTVLVGGLGAGGRGYYALDVTDPSNPIGLWEFTVANDANLGRTYGNPVITKLKDGTWAAIFTSGYNNNDSATGGGDGNGRVYVVNVLTGALIGSAIPTFTTGTTPAGTVATPSNLGRLNAWVEDETNNTARRVYAGDMLGNMWRIDHDDNLAPSGREAFLLAQARTSTGVVQPITVRPQLTEVGEGSNKKVVVSFGTGRYLGTPDLSDTTVQSLYAVKDDLTTTGVGVVRSNGTAVRQTISASFATTTLQPFNFASNSAWYSDFDQQSKERVVVDMQQQFNTLTVATNTPTATACSPGGTGRLYFFDIRSGNILQTQSFGTLIVGITSILVGTEGGAPGTPVTMVTGGTGGLTPVNEPPQTGSGALTPRRTSWRELVR